MRKEGHEPVKRKKAVEAHYDDLGDDISGLNGDLAYLFADYLPECADTESDTDGESEVFIANWVRTPRLQSLEHTTFANLVNRLDKEGEGLDLCELCGGAARPTVIAIR